MFIKRSVRQPRTQMYVKPSNQEHSSPKRTWKRWTDVSRSSERNPSSSADVCKRSSWRTSRENSQKYNPQQRHISSFWRRPSTWLTSGSQSTGCSSLRRMSQVTSAWVFFWKVYSPIKWPSLNATDGSSDTSSHVTSRNESMNDWPRKIHFQALGCRNLP